MIKPIVTNAFFLSLKAKPATKDDVAIANDLIDTLKAHSFECIGMAANMIGEAKAIIVFDDGKNIHEMFNPVITAKSGPYKTSEGCLSLEGERETQRFRTITVEYQDRNMDKHVKKYSAYEAQVIQHEIDHLNGILI